MSWKSKLGGRHILAGLAVLGVGAGVAIGLLGSSPPAEAGFGGSWPNPDCSYTSDGRCGNVGYFSGLQPFPQQANNIAGVLPAIYNYTDPVDGTTKNWAFPGPGSPYYSVNGMAPGVAANNFIAFINNLLNYPNPLGCTITNPNPPADDAVDGGTNPAVGCWAWRRRKLGAAFLVLSMMGGKYTAYPGSAGPPATGPRFVFNNDVQTGFNEALAVFPQWSQMVQQADADGLVNWDEQRNFTAGTPDSTSEDFGHDVAQFENTIGQTSMTIDFRSPGGGEYIINRSCGNTWFRFTPPGPKIPLGFNMNLSALGTTPTVQPGGTGQINMTLNSTGPNPTQPGFLEVQWPGPGGGVTEPCGGNCSDSPNQQPLSFGQSSMGYTHSGIPGITGPDWYWATTPFPTGQFSFSSLTFNVPASAVPGSTITLQICYFPIDMAGDIQTVTVSFTVAAARYPSVVGRESDIHAGGGICGGSMYGGNIDTNPLAGSLGEYVVSAVGQLKNIGTNNGSGDASLRVGPNGGYTDVCRPDLYTYAKTHMPAAASWTSANPATIYPLASPIPGEVPVTLPNGAVQNVAFITGDIRIQGQLNRSLTIVASGQVSIENDITRTGGTNRNNAPGLGIISDGNTEIQCGCGTDRFIDAMIFSDSTIDTCYTAPPGFPWFVPHCDNTLYVKGFLMANDILLHRLGPVNQSGAQPGEVIQMDPTLYLNPPYFFGTGADSGELNGQGERLPLY